MTRAKRQSWPLHLVGDETPQYIIDQLPFVRQQVRGDKNLRPGREHRRAHTDFLQKRKTRGTLSPCVIETRGDYRRCNFTPFLRDCFN